MGIFPVLVKKKTENRNNKALTLLERKVQWHNLNKRQLFKTLSYVSIDPQTRIWEYWILSICLLSGTEPYVTSDGRKSDQNWDAVWILTGPGIHSSDGKWSVALYMGSTSQISASETSGALVQPVPHYFTLPVLFYTLTGKSGFLPNHSQPSIS